MWKKRIVISFISFLVLSLVGASSAPVMALVTFDQGTTFEQVEKWMLFTKSHYEFDGDPHADLKIGQQCVCVSEPPVPNRDYKAYTEQRYKSLFYDMKHPPLDYPVQVADYKAAYAAQKANDECWVRHDCPVMTIQYAQFGFGSMIEAARINFPPYMHVDFGPGLGQMQRSFRSGVTALRLFTSMWKAQR